jgi:hypothetical protein
MFVTDHFFHSPGKLALMRGLTSSKYRLKQLHRSITRIQTLATLLYRATAKHERLCALLISHKTRAVDM